MRAIIYIIGSLAVAILVGCVASNPAQSKGAQEAATREWIACIRAAVKEVDDGKSDPMTVAIAVQPSCNRQKVAVDAAFEPPLTYEQHVRFQQNIEQKNIQNTAFIVLQQRKGS
ncbi:hypothetical protein HB780_18630 [Rhizobium lusitanum]|uniref:hypothetical protein n=1 Tax=Rhizobium lusitanum TaxID=293958 RepID=UPI00160A6314|nr:hypothetical protein [Rhizobium lusitanum]QND47692.1 hypothetical protein HB780_18630 [Rhizobium lusitanum]